MLLSVDVGFVGFGASVYLLFRFCSPCQFLFFRAFVCFMHVLAPLSTVTTKQRMCSLSLH